MKTVDIFSEIFLVLQKEEEMRKKKFIKTVHFMKMKSILKML